MNQLGRRAAWATALCAASAAATAAGRAAHEDNATVTALPAQHALQVSGVIGPRFEPDIRRALRRHPGIRRIEIASPGGLRAQAMRVGELVNRRGLTVRVDGRCASACVLLWAAASSREITAGSRIGLHRSSLDTDLPVPPAVREQLMRRNDRETDAVLRQAGFPAQVVEAGAVTPPTSMAWFHAGDLAGVRFGLLEPAAVVPVAAADAVRGGTAGAASAAMTAP